MYIEPQYNTKISVAQKNGMKHLILIYLLVFIMCNVYTNMNKIECIQRLRLVEYW